MIIFIYRFVWSLIIAIAVIYSIWILYLVMHDFFQYDRSIILIFQGIGVSILTFLLWFLPWKFFIDFAKKKYERHILINISLAFSAISVLLFVLIVLSALITRPSWYEALAYVIYILMQLGIYGFSLFILWVYFFLIKKLKADNYEPKK